MSLADLVTPRVLPKRKGRIVSGLKRDLESEKRKAETLAKYEERQRRERAAAKAARMKALHADPEFKAKAAKGYAKHRATLLELHIERLKNELVAARKAADEPSK